MSINKIALGTAQFGLKYGISNQSGQVRPSEVSKILAEASVNGVQTLDTAIAYGNSEKVLGANDLQAFQVVSKLPEMPTVSSIEQWVAESIDGSLARLSIKQLYGVLLHRPQQLLHAGGRQLYQALLEQKHGGKVSKIGVSVYTPEELEPLQDQFDFDLVQIPFNLFDQRLLSSGLLDRLKDAGVEVHVRSIFLQGLLLMTKEQRPEKFARWQPLWQRYQAWLETHSLSALEGCLRAVAGVDGIDKMVLGVESRLQFEQILQAIKRPTIELPVSLASTDEMLLNPAKWEKL